MASSSVERFGTAPIDVAVVGAGASGLACAIQCAKKLRAQGDADARIVVFEASNKPGRSILASGNGRCNFSNERLANGLDRSMYWNADFVSEAAEALRESDDIGTLPWFRSLGLVWAKPGEDGLLYPYSNKAATVLGVLLAACERWGVEVATDVRVDEVSGGQSSSFVLAGGQGIETSRTVTPGGRVKRKLSWEPFARAAKRVVVATGGVPSQGLVPGHEVVPPQPVLAPLRATGLDTFEQLDGVRAKVMLTISKGDETLFSEVGEVLFRSYGISGIVTFNASRHYVPGAMIHLDFAPDFDEAGLLDLLRFVARSLATEDVTAVLSGMFAPELAAYLGRTLEEVLEEGEIVCGRKGHSGSGEAVAAEAASGADGATDVVDADAATTATTADAAAATSDSPVAKNAGVSIEGKIRALAVMLKRFPLLTLGVNDAVAPQVHRGGVKVSQIDPRTLESKKLRGLYVLGEALDVDGPCGGYNLDWAWTCGIVAGTQLARERSLND